MDGNTRKRLYVLLTTFLVSLFCVHSLCFAEYHDIKEIGIKIDLPADYVFAGAEGGTYFFEGEEDTLFIAYLTVYDVFGNQAAADVCANVSDDQYIKLQAQEKYIKNGIVKALEGNGFSEPYILPQRVVTLSSGKWLSCDAEMKLDREKLSSRFYHAKKGNRLFYAGFCFFNGAKPVTYTDKLISSISFYGLDAASPQPPKAGQGGREETTEKQAAQATAKPSSVEQAQPAAKGDTASGGSAAKSKKTASGLEGMLMKGLVGGIAALIIKLLMLVWDRLKDGAKK